MLSIMSNGAELGGVAWFASATAFAVSMSASPGPNNTMVAASGAMWGFRRSMPHIAGISIGFSFMMVMVAFGAGALLREQPWIHGVLRWAGAAYLAWLAWRIATARPAGGGAATGRPLGFFGAAAFQWVNPKAWIIALGAVVTYTSGTGSALIEQALVIAALFLVVTVMATALWTMVGVGAARVFRSPQALRGFNLAMAGLLLASLVSMLMHD